MIILHHLRVGRSIFMVWQLEELGIEYELKVYHRDPKTFRAQADLQAVHPLGKSPVIEDGSLLLSESSAITTYLLEKFDDDHQFSPPRSDLQSWATHPMAALSRRLGVCTLVDKNVASAFRSGT